MQHDLAKRRDQKDLNPLIPCPTCERPLRYSTDNEFRPFCSDRCKNKDLAGWASESYSIPTTGGTGETDYSEDL